MMNFNNSIEEETFLQQCIVGLVNTEATLRQDPLLQGAFVCEISEKHKINKIFAIAKEGIHYRRKQKIDLLTCGHTLCHG